MYHYVRDSAATPFPAIRALPPALFEQQLDWLQSRYSLVGVRELEAALDGGSPLPRDAALLTFDDGFVDHYRTAFPLLRARGVSGTFFLSHDACEPSPRLLEVHKIHFLLAHLGAARFGRAVRAECRVAAVPPGARAVFGADSWEEDDERAIKQLLNYELPFDEASRILDRLFARELGDSAAFARTLYLDAAMVAEMAGGGMTFGYHTRSHRMLSRLPAAEQARELADGVDWLRELTRQHTVPFCYPWGGRRTYTADTVRLLGECGYSLAFNTERRRVQVGADGRYELPRFDTRDLPPYTSGEADAAAAAVPAEDA
jgi:peptidoglycan/xylan/chitin deacetylase (PgdA/CDA1 family)